MGDIRLVDIIIPVVCVGVILIVLFPLIKRFIPKREHKPVPKKEEHKKPAASAHKDDGHAKGGDHHHGTNWTPFKIIFTLIWMALLGVILVLYFGRPLVEILRGSPKSAPFVSVQTPTKVAPVTAPAPSITLERCGTKEKPYRLKLKPGEITPALAPPSVSGNKIHTIPDNKGRKVLEHYMGRNKSRCGLPSHQYGFCAKNIGKETVTFECWEAPVE